MTTVPPPVVWAQRSNAEEAAKNLVFLTIQVYDIKNIKLDFTSTKLEFSADANDGSKSYQWNIDFYDEIDPELSIKNFDSGNHIYLVLRKKNKQEEYWPRLTKDKVKYRNIKTDFDKWVDEDEQDEKEDDEELTNPMAGMGGAGMGGMPGMGGMGGMPGMGGMGGGAGGMPDLSSLMGGMGGGAGGDFDISKLASQLGGAGGMPDLSALGDLGGLGGGEDAEDAEAEEVEEVSESK